MSIHMFTAKDISFVRRVIQEELCLLLHQSNFAGCNDFTGSPPRVYFFFYSAYRRTYLPKAVKSVPVLDIYL